MFYNQERPRVVAGFRIRIEWLGYILWGELLKQKFVHVDDIQLEKKEKSTYLFKHELLFKGLVFVAIFNLRLNSGACNGVLHTKSSLSENLTIKFGSYIKSADWKNLTIKIGSYIKKIWQSKLGVTSKVPTEKIWQSKLGVTYSQLATSNIADSKLPTQINPKATFQSKMAFA